MGRSDHFHTGSTEHHQQQEWFHASTDPEIHHYDRESGLHLGTRKAAEHALKSYVGGITEDHPTKGYLHRVQIVGPMSNTPARPVKDIYANAIFLRDRGAGYEGEAAPPPHNASDDAAERWATQERRRHQGRGLYYENSYEDKGTVSAVVPHPRHIQHLGVEEINL